ncbi:MAG: hypothetical protein ACXWAC_11060 [Usitatibacter sp.]
MRLAEELERQLVAEQSLFRAQLLREDLARLRKLCELASAADDRSGFATAARRLGWTQGDQRTPELAHVLGPLLDAVYDYEHGEASDESEARIRDAWVALTRERLERLVGCLTTRVPPPED